MSVQHGAAGFLASLGSGSWDPLRKLRSGVTLSQQCLDVLKCDGMQLAGGFAPARKRGEGDGEIKDECNESS